MNIHVPVETPEERVARVQREYWLPTQWRWIESKARLKIMEKTRRYGGSFANNFAMTTQTGTKGNVWDAWIGSRDLLAARLSIHDCKLFARAFNIATKGVPGEVFLDDERNMRAFEIEFANGRFARGLSSSPDAFAGKQGRMSLDEFALHKDPRQLYGIVQPAIMRGGSLSIISTHRGSTNFFNELIREIKEKDNPKGWDFFSITIVQAVAEGLWIKILQNLIASGSDDPRLGWSDDEFLQSLRNECATEEMWQQEYMCNPCDDNSALLTWEEILAATPPPDEMERLLADVPTNAPRYLGMDIGRHNHPSVIWQWVEWKGWLIEESVTPLLNKPFAEQEQVLFDRLQSLPYATCCMDATGLGMQMAENAKRAFPGKVIPVTFNRGSMLEMAVNAKRKFQDGKVRLSNTAKHHYELYSIKQKSGSAESSIVITADASMSDKHSDYAWAAFLGLHAAERPKSPLEVILI